MKALKEKALAFFLGFLAVIVLLEAGLRIEGLLYPKEKTSENKMPAIRHNEDVVILCIGDSYTYGMGAGYDDSYPRQLEKMLNAGNFKKRFTVINGGVVASNSSQALKKLQKDMEEYNPGLVVALVGVKNENLDDSNYWLFVNKKEVGARKYYCKRIDYFLSKFRTYRLLKMLESNLKSKAAAYKTDSLRRTKDNLAEKGKKENKPGKSPGNKQGREKECIDLGFAYLEQRKFKLAMEQAEKALEINPESESGHLILGSIYRRERMYDLAKAEISKAIEIDPHNESAYLELGYIYYDEGRDNPDIKEKDMASAIDLFNKVIDANPWDVTPYLTLGHIYFFEQGRADLAIKTARKALEINPSNKEARRRLNIYLQPSVDERTTDKLLEYDLENIVKLARNGGAAVILLGYPNIDAKDGIRREVAERYGIPFIDTYSIFNNLLKEHDQKAFFSNDANHCNGNGYRIIAKEIYKIINSDLTNKTFEVVQK